MRLLDEFKNIYDENKKEGKDIKKCYIKEGDIICEIVTGRSKKSSLINNTEKFEQEIEKIKKHLQDRLSGTITHAGYRFSDINLEELPQDISKERSFIVKDIHDDPIGVLNFKIDEKKLTFKSLVDKQIYDVPLEFIKSSKKMRRDIPRATHPLGFRKYT